MRRDELIARQTPDWECECSSLSRPMEEKRLCISIGLDKGLTPDVLDDNLKTEKST